MKPGYYVRTWDSDAAGGEGDFTPQPGVPEGPYTLWGLRKALRELRHYGYPADRGDPSVLVFLNREEGGPVP